MEEEEGAGPSSREALFGAGVDDIWCADLLGHLGLGIVYNNGDCYTVRCLRSAFPALSCTQEESQGGGGGAQLLGCLAEVPLLTEARPAWRLGSGNVLGLFQ